MKPSGYCAADSTARRITLNEWIATGDRFAFVGEAGSGKSTLLRCIALDLLSSQSHFPSLAERWGHLLPLHIPFARWSREVVKSGGQIGLKEIVRRTLQPLLTAELVNLVDRAVEERRVLLLVDGLDEWSDEQGARTALHELLTFVGAHNIPAVISARPRGLHKIGAIPSDWRMAEIAPLSLHQQRLLSSRWFDRYGVSATSQPDRSKLATLRTDQFMAELSRDRGLTALAEIPLLGVPTLGALAQCDRSNAAVESASPP